MVDLPGRIRGNIYYFETASGMIIWANIDFEEKHRRAKLVHGDVFYWFRMDSKMARSSAAFPAV